MSKWQAVLNGAATSTGPGAAASLAATRNETPPSEHSFWPEPPQTIEETGLLIPFIEDHLIRILYFSQQMTGAELANACGLSYPLVQPLIRRFARDHVFEVVGQNTLVESGYRFMLAPRGRERADEALHRTWYHGPLPVPLSQYVAAMRAQSATSTVIRREALRDAFADLVISEDFLDRIGPAVNAGGSIFLYGAPGNGKTVIAERLTRTIGGAIFIPTAIEADGSVIQLYDELNHRQVTEQTERRHDGRWTRIRRPVVITGGELIMASLDLIWNDVGKFYEAPLQMKANGGTFLIDDFGRQLVRPVELLNRWIVPLEKRVDYLTLQTGKKLEIPFELLLIMSTNLNPADLADEAFQRRIRSRVFVDDPDETQFAKVFAMMCAAWDIPFDLGALEWLLSTWWRPHNRPMRMVHPRDLVNQLVAIANYLGRPPAMTPDLLDLACRSYFVLDLTKANTAARMS